MAVTITDNRTVVDEADSVTGWTSAAGVAVFTAAPDPVEATGSLGTQVSNTTESAYFTRASSNITSTCVYAWLLPGGVLDTTVNGGIQIYLGDGTNDRGYHLGGSNGAGFRHDDGPVVWQCFSLDTSALPASTTNFVGAGNPNFAAVTRFGNVFKTLAKSVGGQENCFIDIAFFGNGGLTITGGGTGTEGKFLEIAVRDRSTADHPGTGVASAVGGAYGACRELGADLFGIQTRMQFGDDVGTLSVDFEDTGQTILFENRGFGVDKYGYTITGNATGTTRFVLGTRTGIGTGSEGCNLVTPAGVGAFFTATNANIDTLGIYDSGLNGFTQGVTFTTDATAGPNHEIFATSFAGCGLITVGTTEFKNNSISGSTAVSAALISSTTDVSDLIFTSAGTGHAITIEAVGTYDFTDITFAGYAGTDGVTGNEAFYNNSGGAVTINVSGGGVPTIRNGAGASTTIVATVTITITGLKDNTEVRIYDSLDTTPPYTTPTELAGIDIATGGTTNDRSFAFSATPSSTIYIKTINIAWIADNIVYLVPNTTASLPIAQRRDRVYSNPV